MRQKKEYYVITFSTTTAAMAMEKACMEAGIPGRLIPVPREITAGCGLAFRILSEDYVKYQPVMASFHIPQEASVLLYL